MKKLFTVLAASVFGLGMVCAQGFTVKCNNQEVTNGCTITVEEELDFDNTFDVSAHFVLTAASKTEAVNFTATYEVITAAEKSQFSYCYLQCQTSKTITGTIKAGGSVGATELDDFHLAYQPEEPAEDEQLEPAEVKMTMVNDKTQEKIEFTIKFIPKKAQTVANENAPRVNVAVYPNPAYNEANFRLNGVTSGALVVLRDINGRAVRTIKVGGDNTVAVNVAGLASGLYFYTVEEQGLKVYTGKLMVR